jgi:methionine-rich copper-binding protein CopC
VNLLRRVPGRTGSAVLAAAVSLGALVAAAGPAQAHAALVRMVPADGSTVRTAPPAVTLIFDEAVQARYDVVAVTAADGTRVSAGTPSVHGAAVRQPVKPLTTAGRYTVAYRVMSDDGHPISRRLGFTYAPVDSPSNDAAKLPPPSPAAAVSGTRHSRPAVLVPLLLLVGAGVTLWRRGRRRRPT